MRHEPIELQHLPRVNAEPRPNSGSEEDHDDAGEGEGKGVAQLDASLHAAGKGRLLIEIFDACWIVRSQSDEEGRFCSYGRPYERVESPHCSEAATTSRVGGACVLFPIVDPFKTGNQ